jgi:hypothetical protein
MGEMHAEQEEQHRERSNSEELKLFVERHDKTVETVDVVPTRSSPR